MIIQLFSQAAFIIVLYMGAWFIIAQIKKNNSIVDIAWGLGFILLTWFSFFKDGSFLARQILVSTLVTLWGTRISGQIAIRNFGKGEDPRYTEMKKNWGRLIHLYSFLIVFMLQGFLILVIATPILIINNSNNAGLNLLDYLGTSVWLVGYLFETIGDLQLYSFLKNPVNKGKVMQTGLWRFSRHPNYFGETVLWWGIWLISLSVPYGIFCIISPLTITYLLLHVSGVPMAERHMIHLDGFEEYKQKTSRFVPWFPRTNP